jgi:hypothetical protein
MIEDLAKSVSSFLDAAMRVALVFTRRHWVTLLSLTVFVLCFQTIYRDYADLADNELVVFTGLPGSNCHEIAGKLRDALQRHSTAFGGRYKVRIEETRGVDEIEERIRADTTGSAIGFAQDERGNAPAALAVAPLELDYLHVIAGNGFLHRVAKRKAMPRPKPGEISAVAADRTGSDVKAQPGPSAVIGSDGEMATDEVVVPLHSISIRDIIAHLNAGDFADSGRVYLGPLRSETRRLAELVFQQCGVRNVARLSAHGISDWYEMRAALNSGAVAMAFYIGPLGSEVVKGIADDGNCILVNLDGFAEALESEHPEFKAAKILKHAYTAAAYRKDAPEFCGATITTLTSRNIIVCAAKMSDYDAYQVAAAADEALMGDFPAGLWKQRPTGGVTDLTLATRVHSGAELKQYGKEPPARFWSLPGWTTALASAVGLLFLSGSLEWLTRRIAPERLTTPIDSAGGAASAHETPSGAALANQGRASANSVLVRELERLDQKIKALESRPAPMTVTDWTEEQCRLQNDHVEVLAARDRGDLTRDESHILFQALRNIHAELEFLKPSPHKKKPKPRHPQAREST